MKRFVQVISILIGMAILFSVVSASYVKASPSDSVRVWVEYQKGYKEVVRAALKGVDAKFHYEFDDLDSFVVTIPGKALNGIVRNPHVVDVEEDAPRYLIESKPVVIDNISEPDPNHPDQDIPYGIDAVQARQLWDSNNDGVVDTDAPTGEGITVCIIDTGFYADHEDLNTITANGMSQISGEVWSEDGYGHGTHVAGTISAVNNDLGVVGVTPGTVNFYIVKYFANDGLYVPGASDLVAAINECSAHGAKVINMSLGGSSSNRKEQKAFDNLYAAGILSIAAAGNEESSDPHYPASYDSVVSVSAVDEDNVFANFSNYGADIELTAPGVDVLSTIPYVSTNSITVDGVIYSANQIEFAALGSASGPLVDGGLCGTTGSWAGAVVLCERGEFSFAEKVLNVQNSGGVAAVIYNNEPGNFLGTMGEDSATILGISLSQEDGQYLVANKLDHNGDVYSHLEKPASGYEAWGGTSMATPHVSGVAALIWSADPSLTNVQIREAMNETAYDLGDDGWDQYFGNGLVQAADALAYLGLGPSNNPPDVSISSPADGAVFESGAVVSFAGSASDIEDGNISADLVWVSDLDGRIGTGATFSTVLSDGAHTITAEAVDSGGKTGSASINVTVGSAPTDTMSVSAIDMSYTKRGRSYTVNTSVTIWDGHVAVAGATVQIRITLPGGGTYNGTGVTGSDGTVTFSLSTKDSGLYVSEVINVTHASLVYDPAENEVTTGSISIP